ncbi:MAG: lysoplasmalogenase [Acidimicrobiales bacterium]|nr:lysoplasmalogenase [Acidimicrobiales bacterium]
MTGTAGVLLAVTAVAAVIDWIAVRHEHRPVEYVFKPLTLVALTGTALALDPADPTVRTWFVVALVLSLVGDVFLMLPGDLFVPGLGSFLLAHVAYVVGLVLAGLDPLGVLAGLVVVGAALVVVGVPLVRGIRRTEPAMAPPVVAYMGVISAMVVCAVGTGHGLAIAGALLFFASDSLIGWGRFVKSHDWGRVAVMVTYHVGQTLLVLSLV